MASARLYPEPQGQFWCGLDFAAVAMLDDYHVFVTAYDGDHLLHVTNQGPTGFTVRAQDSHGKRTLLVASCGQA